MSDRLIGYELWLHTIDFNNCSDTWQCVRATLASETTSETTGETANEVGEVIDGEVIDPLTVRWANTIEWLGWAWIIATLVIGMICLGGMR